MKINNYYNERGNVLFLILIAVALFAALSYAVTQSTRGGGNDGNEDVAINASQIVQWASLIRNSIQRLQIINGCSDTEISFENASLPTHINPNSPADSSCHVFHPNGGGLSFPNSVGGESFIDFIGIHCYLGIGSSACSQDTKELELNFINIPLELCIEINKKLDIGTAGAMPPSENYTSSNSTPFKGVYNPDTSSAYIIDTPETNYKPEGCYTDNVGSFNGYHIFYMAMIER